MKCLVLLALVGLASCRTALIGGNNAKDVTIYYTYEDQRGEDVDVQYEADHLNLSALKTLPAVQTKKAAPTPALRATSSPKPKTPLSALPSLSPVPKLTPRTAPAPKAQVLSIPLTPVVQFLPVATIAVQPSAMQLTASLGPVAQPPAAPRQAPAPLSAPAPRPLPAPAARPLPAVRKTMAAVDPPVSTPVGNKNSGDSEEN